MNRTAKLMRNSVAYGLAAQRSGSNSGSPKEARRPKSTSAVARVTSARPLPISRGRAGRSYGWTAEPIPRCHPSRAMTAPRTRQMPAQTLRLRSKRYSRVVVRAPSIKASTPPESFEVAAHDLLLDIGIDVHKGESQICILEGVMTARLDPVSYTSGDGETRIP